MHVVCRAFGAEQAKEESGGSRQEINRGVIDEHRKYRGKTSP
jgi:hypothetical protein